MIQKQEEKQSVGEKGASPPATLPRDRILDAKDLLGGDGAVTIRHGDQIYVLRETRQGKLILNK